MTGCEQADDLCDGLSTLRAPQRIEFAAALDGHRAPDHGVQLAPAQQPLDRAPRKTCEPRAEQHERQLPDENRAGNGRRAGRAEIKFR